jgi:hypothetical protein
MTTVAFINRLQPVDGKRDALIGLLHEFADPTPPPRTPTASSATRRPATRTAWTSALHILTDLHHPDADTVHAKLATLDQTPPTTQPGASPAQPGPDHAGPRPAPSVSVCRTLNEQPASRGAEPADQLRSRLIRAVR